jgi:hypothetical protein
VFELFVRWRLMPSVAAISRSSPSVVAESSAEMAAQLPIGCATNTAGKAFWRSTGYVGTEKGEL